MNFSDIEGHKKNIELIKKIINEGKVFHSYLFSGVDGCGKKLVALAFARMILCKGIKSEECDCESCRMFKKKTHPDFMLVDMEFQALLNGEKVEEQNSIKISTIREVIKFSSRCPSFSDKKVIIIDDSHKMVVEAQNAILKTLEEPGQTSVFILISPSLNLLLPTIVSRCYTLNFNGLDYDELIRVLIKNSVDEKTASQAAESCNGSVSFALKHADIFRIIKENSDKGMLAPFIITSEILSSGNSKNAVNSLIDIVNSRIHKLMIESNSDAVVDKAATLIKRNLKYREFLRHNVNTRLVSFMVLYKYFVFRKEISNAETH